MQICSPATLLHDQDRVAILPPEAEKSGFAPSFNFQQLQTDIDAVAN